MLEIVFYEYNYLIDYLDEIEVVIVDFFFNVQDDCWLVYCIVCGYEYFDLFEIDECISIGELDLFYQVV